MQEVTVEKLISNGHGLTRGNDGRVLFLPGALPGERWQVDEVVKRKGSFWASGQRLSDAPERVEPACPHFSTCGGCALLHIHPRFELKFKIDYLRDVLKRLGGINLGEVNAVDFPAKESRIRGKLHTDVKGNVGFHMERANRVTAIQSCHVLPKSLVALLPDLSEAVKKSRFEGDIYFITDAEAKKPCLELQGTVKPGGEKKKIWNSVKAEGLLLRGWDGHTLYKQGNRYTDFQWNHLEVSLSPRSFLQSNPASWEVFGETVKSYQQRWKPTRIWDAHAGAGFLSSFLSNVEVWASEPNRDAFDQLRTGLKKSGLTHRVFQGTAESAIKREFFEPGSQDGLILDPPREGLTNPLRQWIVDKGPGSVLYFSCDIASFARDVRHLNEGYDLQSPLLVMNVNPGTLRLELGATLIRR